MKEPATGVIKPGGFLKKFLNFALRTGEETVRLHKDFCRLIGLVGNAGSLLDVGSGDGSLTAEYKKILNIPSDNICGIELLGKYTGKYPGYIKVSKVNLENERFPYPDESFDLVVCNQVLEHLKNIFLPLSEMERVLKPGGHLAIGIPNLAALHNRLLLFSGSQPLCNNILGPHIRCFAHKGFLKFLRSNPNFRLVACAGSSLYPLPFPLVEIGAKLLPGLSTYTSYLLLKEKRTAGESAWMRTSIGDTFL